MSQDSKYQFHMGCGEALRSQWWQAGMVIETLRAKHTGKPGKAVRAGRKPRGGRKE